MEKISPNIVNSCRACTARCCRGLAVVLTMPEAIRLLSATGLRAEEALEFRRDIDSRATPHYPLLVRTREGSNTRGQEPASGGCASCAVAPGGVRAPAVVVEEWFIIIRRQGRDCIFLNADLSCSIYSARPFVCRLYPLELDGKSVKKGALCPVKFAREASMEEDAARLKEDLLSHEVMARRWSHERGKHGERPDIARFSEYFKAEPAK